MFQVDDCPSAQELQRFVVGEISESEGQQFEQHLSGCKQCLAMLQGLQPEDTLVQAVREQRQVDNSVEDIALTELIARLAADPPAGLRDHSGEMTQALDKRAADDNATVAPEADSVEPENTLELIECLQPAQSADEIGRLGSYRVLRLLGMGGMGVVFQAEDTQLQRVVALKTLLPALAARSSARQRFLREARAAAAIEHEHVIPIFQVGEANGVPFFAMPFLKGESLDDRIKRDGSIPIKEVLRIGREIAEGLAAAHEHGVIHRDIKPGNIWLEGARGRVKILDFGLARAGLDSANLTQQGMVMGTPAFMAPEQVNGRAVDGRTDLFSLGCVLYRMTTGKLPFLGKDTLSILVSVGTLNPASPQTLCPDLPPALDNLIMRMLAKTPDQRPPSASAVAQTLEAIEKDSTQEISVLRPSEPLPKLPTQRSQLLGRALLALALLVLVLIGVGAYYRWSTRPKPTPVPIEAPVAKRGQMEIYTDDPDAKVVIQQNGTVVETVDLRSKRKVNLLVGDYALSLADDPEDLKIEPPTVTLENEQNKIVIVRRVPIPKPELLHSVTWFDIEQRINANLYESAISADNQLFLGGGDVGPSGLVRIFDLANGLEVKQFRRKELAKHWIGTHVRFVPGGKYVAVSYSNDASDKDIYLWEIATGNVVRKFTGHTDTGNDLAVSPDGKLLLSWANDKTVRLWDMETAEEILQLKVDEGIESGTFSHNGKSILTIGRDKTLRWSDVATGKHLQKWTGFPYGVISPSDKEILAFTDQGEIHRLNVENGEETLCFEGTNSRSGFRGYVAGGRQIAAFCTDNRFRVWDTATGMIVQTIDQSNVLQDRELIVPSPDGRLALASLPDFSVRVFDLTTGKEIHRYDNCPGARAFSFSSDSKMAVSGSFRGGMRVYRLPSVRSKKP